MFFTHFILLIVSQICLRVFQLVLIQRKCPPVFHITINTIKLQIFKII